MILGKCPYCDDGQIEVKKKKSEGKKLNYMLVLMQSGQQKMGNFLSLQVIQNVVLKYGKMH